MANPRIRYIVQLEERISSLEVSHIPQCIRPVLGARNDSDDAGAGNVAAKLARRMRNDFVKRGSITRTNTRTLNRKVIVRRLG
jgi:hypothetical protein